MTIKSVMPSNHLILCHPHPLPPSIFPSIRVFSKVSVLCIRLSKYWSFSNSISPSNEYLGRFPLGWTGWTSCSPRDSQESSPTPQFKSINSSAFFTVQFSHPYTTTGKTITWTRQTPVGKVMFLLFNMLSRLLTRFSYGEQVYFNFMAAVTICSDFGAPQNKVCYCFHCFPIYLP